ncbi:hypothetical protein PybrP1_008554 [[Pythium] brassicae (nom. inval.)]|nr:hypothetical protein PybrP1_008554 [[Pythium] brassicae (nom. inval.)]
MPPNVGAAATATATGVSSASSAARRVLARSTTLLRDLATPCYLPPTAMGHTPHLTPDNYAKEPELRARFVDFADLAPALDFVRVKQTAFRTFLRLEDAQLVLTARDYVNRSNPPVTKAGFAVETCTGRRTVSPREYMEVVRLLQPELVVPLADEIAASFGDNRQRVAVERSLDWLDACIAHREREPICGVILGGADERLRRLSAAETCRRDVQAVLISGLDSCDCAETRGRLIDVVVDEVAASASPAAAVPRLVSGVGEPLQILDAVSRGVDGFVSTYPATLTSSGAALAFWVDASADDDSAERVRERERSGSLLHLREPRFERDFRPLLHGCDCFACRQYTRAYVHHLLNVREILGDVLLYLHNLHQYYRFFRVMRREIKAGNFARFAQTFQERYRAHASQAPPLAVPLAIRERQEREEAERAEQRARLAAEKAAKARERADLMRRGRSET